MILPAKKKNPTKTQSREISVLAQIEHIAQPAAKGWVKRSTEMLARFNPIFPGLGKTTPNSLHSTKLGGLANTK